MRKKIAIPTQNGKLSKDIISTTNFNLFEFENDCIVGVEHGDLGQSSVKQVLLWLVSRNVTELYIDEISLDVKKKLNFFGIIVKTARELSDDALFNCFIFK